MRCVDEPLTSTALALCHVPQAVDGPLRDRRPRASGGDAERPRRERVRLPCFFFTRDYAILPAFGPFTGMADVEPRKATACMSWPSAGS